MAVAAALAELEDALTCTVCRAVVAAPVCPPCGHVACSLCLRGWLAGGAAACPTCRAPVPSLSAVVAVKAMDRAATGFRALAAALAAAAPDRTSTGAAGGAVAPSPPLPARSGAAANAALYTRRAPPVYNMISDKALKADLVAFGVPATGARDVLVWRHREYLSLWNAQLDAAAPLHPSALPALVGERERERARDKAGVAKWPLAPEPRAAASAAAQRPPPPQLPAGGGRRKGGGAAAESIDLTCDGDSFDSTDGVAVWRGGADDDDNPVAVARATATAAAALPPLLPRATSAPAAPSHAAAPPAASAAPLLLHPRGRPPRRVVSFEWKGSVTVTREMADGFALLAAALRERMRATRAARTPAAPAPSPASLPASSPASLPASLPEPDDTAAAAALAAAGASLPPQWRVVWSTVMSRPFYFNTLTGVGAFTPPPPPQSEPLAGVKRSAAASQGCADDGTLPSPPRAKRSRSAGDGAPTADSGSGAVAVVAAAAARVEGAVAATSEGAATATADGAAPATTDGAATATADGAAPATTDGAATATTDGAAPAPAAAVALPKGSWQCAACTYINRRAARKCTLCRTAAPAS